jgi:hypothetical protein
VIPILHNPINSKRFMKSSTKLFTVLMAAVIAIPAFAQTYVLDNFNSGTATGAVDTGTSWNGQITQNATTLTVGGTAKSDSGWFYNFALPVDLTGYSLLEITAQRDSGHATGFLAVTFSDDTGSGFQTIYFDTNLFAIGAQTTVTLPVAWTIDSTIIAGWNIGGGETSPGTTAFRMTFDNMALTNAAIPEPSTYAAILGAMALGFVAYRRRQQAA